MAYVCGGRSIGIKPPNGFAAAVPHWVAQPLLPVTDESGHHVPLIASLSADAQLLAMLTLFNESTSMDDALQRSLDLVTTALDARIGEIWLFSGDARQVHLHYSSSDGTPGVAFFAASGSAFGVGAGPSLVGHVLKTGRGSPLALSGGDGGRAADAAAAGVPLNLRRTLGEYAEEAEGIKVSRPPRGFSATSAEASESFATESRASSSSRVGAGFPPRAHRSWGTHFSRASTSALPQP